MTLFQAIIIGIVEGITEFLPVSSTGHMIITSSLMGINNDKFTELFEVVIQLGAIFSVVVLYWKKFFDFKRLGFYLKLFVAVLPALLFGYLFSDRIHELLKSPAVVGYALLGGGIVLMFIDRFFTRPQIENEREVSYLKAFTIGMWQVLAMIPGVSRSAATIIGGMQQKLNRKAAAEFSFFLAVPTMLAASAHDLLKAYKDDPGMIKDQHNLMLLGVGGLVAFLVAMIAIRSFIGYLQKHSFKVFGLYRILAGIAILALVYTNVI